VIEVRGERRGARKFRVQNAEFRVKITNHSVLLTPLRRPEVGGYLTSRLSPLVSCIGERVLVKCDFTYLTISRINHFPYSI